jgi:hypothetical protein
MGERIWQTITARQGVGPARRVRPEAGPDDERQQMPASARICKHGFAMAALPKPGISQNPAIKPHASSHSVKQFRAKTLLWNHKPRMR